MKNLKKFSSGSKFDIKVDQPISANFLFQKRVYINNNQENQSEKVLKFSEYAVDDSPSSQSEVSENYTEMHLRLKNVTNSCNRLTDILNPNQSQPNHIFRKNTLFPSLLSFQKYAT
jgi:hypothetical protein